MLRITIEDGSNPIVLRVEGKLKGPWVTELEKCWRSTSDRATGSLRVNLDSVDFVDGQGHALLAEMAMAGVELIASGLMMRCIIQQVSGPCLAFNQRSVR